MSELVGMPDNFQEFLSIRGHLTNISGSEGKILEPTTPEEIQRAGELTSLLSEMLAAPELVRFRRQASSMAWSLVSDGKITTDQHMEIIREYEKLEEGGTYEDTIKSHGGSGSGSI